MSPVMRIFGVLILAALMIGGGFLMTEALGLREPSTSADRCAEATDGARQAFEAGPMARGGLRLAELSPGRRAEAGQAAAPGLVLCRAEALFANGMRDTLWFALVPMANGADGRFMVHAAPGDIGRRSILALR